MNSFVMFAVFALAAVANCEAPGGYNYNRPQFGGGVSAGGNALSSGGSYEQEAIGASTNEGLQVDQQLLEQVKQILLREESKAGSGASAGGNFGAPSSQYGAPAPQYGPPAQSQGRVVGIILENTQPAIQVAQFRSQSQAASGGYSAQAGGYPASNFGVAPSSNYGAPAPSRPSSNYGVPSY